MGLQDVRSAGRGILFKVIRWRNGYTIEITARALTLDPLHLSTKPRSPKLHPKALNPKPDALN